MTVSVFGRAWRRTEPFSERSGRTSAAASSALRNFSVKTLTTTGDVLSCAGASDGASAPARSSTDTRSLARAGAGRRRSAGCTVPSEVDALVDDEDALRNVLSSELQSEGYSVVSAADGDEAISILQQKSFDLVLLDIKMPRVDGFEVLRFIKERHANTKVIMLTGFADLKNAIESKKLGAEDFVSKPYDLVDLLTTIERVLSAE
ncbi:MAG: response regulator [Acidobacteria bacterium]|nr:MAG: response regulator [Acidobacteriota bacterium]